MDARPIYTRALTALQAAHDACFNNTDRPVTGMSHGPFSGVNEALGIVATLEDENKLLRKALSAGGEKILGSAHNMGEG